MHKVDVGKRNTQTEKWYCRSALYGVDPDTLIRGSHESLSAKYRPEKKAKIAPCQMGKNNVWWLSCETPNQKNVDGKDASKACLDLLGILHDKEKDSLIWMLAEAKQGENSDSFQKALSELCDYCWHIRSQVTRKREEREIEVFKTEISYLYDLPNSKKITWPPDPGEPVVLTVIADQEWWEKRKENAQKFINDSWPFIADHLAGASGGNGEIHFLAVQVDWRKHAKRDQQHKDLKILFRS